MTENNKVERWLNTCIPSTKHVYEIYFRAFENYVGKSGEQILVEHRKNLANLKNPDATDIYPEKVFLFYRHLLSGEIKAKLMGSKKGNHGGWTGKFRDKGLSQNTARAAITGIQSFFSYNNMPMNLKKFTRKDQRMNDPRSEHKKHLLLSSEIEALLKVANMRDKAILALGLMGQDESTIASLTIEMFEGKVNGTQLELIETVRPKTNKEIMLLLTREVQDILKTYIQSLDRKNGVLFQGYKDRSIKPKLCNDQFRTLCRQAGIKNGNGKRLSFHCCRMWFSTVLRNKISDDIIDLLTGHAQRFKGAYLGEENLPELLTKAHIEDLLRFQPAAIGQQQKAEIEDLRKEIEGLKQKYDEMLGFSVRYTQKMKQKIEDLGTPPVLAYERAPEETAKILKEWKERHKVELETLSPKELQQRMGLHETEFAELKKLLKEKTTEKVT